MNSGGYYKAFLEFWKELRISWVSFVSRDAWCRVSRKLPFSLCFAGLGDAKVSQKPLQIFPISLGAGLIGIIYLDTLGNP